LEQVVVINRKRWSSSIGPSGRHQSEALVVFNWNRWSPSAGAGMGAALLPEAQRTKDAGGDGFRYGLSGAPARRSHQRRDGEMQSFSGTLRKRSGAVLRH
jgi:hypothetical protein